MTETEAEISRPSKRRKRIPSRGNRYVLHEDGCGDFRIYQIYTAEGTDIPKESLLPLPGVPGFPTKTEASKWIDQNAQQLNGMYVAIIKIQALGFMEVKTVSTVKMKWKPKKLVKKGSDE